MHMKAAFPIVVLLTLIGCGGGKGMASTDTLTVSAKTLADLAAIRAESKFHEDKTTFYPGAVDEPTRIHCELGVNELLDRLISGLAAHPTKQFVLDNFRQTLQSSKQNDSEDADQLLRYIERIMTVVGVESSDGLLNQWRYGFNPKHPN